MTTYNMQTDLVLSPEQAGDLLTAWLGTRTRCTGIDRLVGGMINTVLRLRFDREPFSAVVKLNRQGTTFAREASVLRHLRERGFPCPEVYLVDDTIERLPYTFLLLETLPGVSMHEVHLAPADRDRVEREMAEALVSLHGHTRETFGPIDGSGERQWVDVFMPDLCGIRTQPQIEARLSYDVLADVDRAIMLAPALLQDQGAPTLIHGDIWAANVIVHQGADGWHLSGLIDPSTQYADVEMELAYLRGFNGAWDAFFETYTARSPMRPGYERRWWVYWLRTYLIHVWLFGDQHYRDFAAQAARHIAADGM
jgi:fructosamine-3-kinase